MMQIAAYLIRAASERRWSALCPPAGSFLDRAGAWNRCSNFAFIMGAEEALRSVLRVYSVFQYLNHLSVASPSP